MSYANLPRSPSSGRLERRPARGAILLAIHLSAGALSPALAQPGSSTEPPAANGAGPSAPEPAADPVGAITRALSGPVAELVAETLERNPRVALMERRYAAFSARPDQAGSLPDPVAGLGLFLLPPETRVGPQRLSATLSQRLPWFGKLSLRRQAAVLGAEAAAADVDSVRLEVITEARRLFYELAFQEELGRILNEERQVLRRNEEAARARYSAGMGLQQEVVRIQAQLTRIAKRILDLEERKRTLLALLNRLRDRPASDPVEGLAIPTPAEPRLDLDGLRTSAERARPELISADASIARHQTMVELAKKDFKPDFMVGLGYTAVDRRRDAAGRASPPPDDGDDILMLNGSVNVPIYRRRLNAGLEESLELRGVAEEAKHQIRAEIESSIGDLASRLPLQYEEWKLLEDVLLIQAEEALRSAEAAYTTGRLSAVDLLDAEVVLFEVHTSIARTLTDFAVGWAQLERAAATPLELMEPIEPIEP